MNDDVNEFLFGGGAKAFPFDSVGDTARGEIVNAEKRQQREVDSGKPATWDDGSPKMMLVVVLQTTERDSEDDDGLRSVYLRGGNPVPVEGKGTSSMNAVRDAVKRSGAKGLETGGHLTLRYSGNAKAKRGFSAAKCYEAAYKAPVSSIALDDLA